ncbi:hypothetical protein BC834DRAFT_849606 [Gloeopeniophorella convolvens]|nr:hypothetical protein BC834DRAFT_849606 [Gloeopeniophorella convolvens]
MDKGKVTAKVNLSNVIYHPGPPSRPQSPFTAKSPPPLPSSVLSDSNFRPKAKVNSSATVIVRKPSGSSTVSSGPKSAPRPTSPFKPTFSHAKEFSSARSAVDVPPSRSKATLTAHALSRQRSLTSSGDASLGRNRRSSGSFQPNASPSPLSSHLSPASASAQSPTPVIRVKAKVTGLAKSNGPPGALSAPTGVCHASSPPYATTRPIDSRSRAPLIPNFGGGSVSQPPSPTISAVPIVPYPVTTAIPSANSHRYGQRAAPSPTTLRFQSLSSPSSHDYDIDPRLRAASKVDPATIPLPPQSPPVSTLSFSSRSSQSSQNTQSSLASGSTAPTFNSHINGMNLVSRDQGVPSAGSDPTLDALGELFDPDSPRTSVGSPPASDSQLGDPDREIRAEAKSNRKIEDLKITNKSLLAINSTLEATKHRQAKEIRELRRKLRESRLVLPPRAFREIKSSLGPEDAADDEDVDDEDEDEVNEDDEDDGRDEAYNRIKGLVEGLLDMGRRALRATPDDFRGQSNGVKVLSAEEVRSWQGRAGDDLSSMFSAPTDNESDEEGSSRRRPLTPSRIAIPGDDETDFEDELEVTMGTEHNTGTLPPITVTFS